MPEIKFARFSELLKFLPKSKIKAGDGQESGRYPFYTSSATLSKYIDTFDYENESLIFGSGGNASIHYCNEKFATSTDCFVVNKDSENIDVKYVYYYLKSNMKILEDGFKGAGLKHISKKYISEIKIPLLPLQDQQKIAQQLSQIEELISKREKSINLLDELIKSTFLDMFMKSDYLKNPRLLGNYIQYMTSGSRGWAQYYNDLGALFLRIQNVNNGKLILDDVIRVQLPNKTEGTRTRVQENDLLMSITADLGRTAVIPKDFEEAYINQHLALLRLNSDLVNPMFLAHYFCTDFAKLQVQKYNKGGAKAGLNFTDIKKIHIIIPPKYLQDKFAEIVNQIERTKNTYQNSLNELNNLFGSIAQKAFKGVLDVSKTALIEQKILIQESRQIIENEVVYADENNYPIFDKNFLKMLIHQAGNLTNQKLLEVIEKFTFRENVAFDEIKKYIIELLKNQEIEQIVITTEKVNGFEKEIGFKIL